jgi:hypothetical protein
VSRKRPVIRSEKLTRPAGVHPALSAVEFAARTNAKPLVDPQGVERGLTMNVHTGVTTDEKPAVGYAVGGERDVQGKRINTKKVSTGRKDPKISANEVSKFSEKVRLGTKDKNVNIGAWVDSKNPKSGVQLDASRVYTSKKEATKKMEERKEDAMYDVQTFDTVRNTKKKPKEKNR